MPRKWDSRMVIRILLILLVLGSAANASALLILPTAVNGNLLTPGPGGDPNRLVFAASFNNLQPIGFDVLFESTDDPFSPIAVTGLLENLTVTPWSGLTMTLGGGATLTTIGDAMPGAIVNAFSRGTAAEFAFNPAFAVNASGEIGGSDPWLVNTHGARLFSVSLNPVPFVAARSAQVPEPATLALALFGFAAMRVFRPRPATAACL